MIFFFFFLSSRGVIIYLPSQFLCFHLNYYLDLKFNNQNLRTEGIMESYFLQCIIDKAIVSSIWYPKLQILKSAHEIFCQKGKILILKFLNKIFF